MSNPELKIEVNRPKKTKKPKAQPTTKDPPKPKPTKPAAKPKPAPKPAAVPMDEGSVQGAMSALARKFPDMMPPTIGMTGYPSNVTLPNGAYKTKYMLVVPNFTPSTEPGIYMGMAFVTPRLTNHTFVVNTWTGDSVTGPSSTTSTTANSPNTAQLTTLSAFHAYTGICVRVLNASSMMNASGTFLIASIAQSAIGGATPASGVWTTLNAAPGVEKLVFPKDANRCIDYQASMKGDFDPDSISTSGIGANLGCIVFMYRSTVAQAIQLEITEIGTHSPLASSAGLIPTTRVLANPVVFEQVINKATTADVMNSAAEKPAQRKSLFDKVANALGPHVRSAIGKLPGGGLVNGAYDFLSNLFGAKQHLPLLMRVLSQGHGLAKEMEDPSVASLLPTEVHKAILALSKVEVMQAADHMFIKVANASGHRVYKVGYETAETDPFTCSTTTPYCVMHSEVIAQPADESKSDGSFVALTRRR